MTQYLDNAWLGGKLVPLAQARISPLDRGWLFGEGVYELIPVYAGSPLGLPAHLERLQASLEKLELDEAVRDVDFDAVVHRLIAANGSGDMSVYLQVTRGADPEKRDHAYGPGLRATVFGMCQRLAPRAASVAEQGVAAVLREDARWNRCDIKSTSLLANTMLRTDARRADAIEAILHRSGYVTEGAASSVFVVHEGRLVTTEDSEEILPGTTRELVIDLAASLGVPTLRSRIPVAALKDADEIWMASSTKEVLPVTRLDGEPVGDGRPGPLWQRVNALYQDCKAQLVSA